MNAFRWSVYCEGFGIPYRVNRIANGGGIMLFVREDTPLKLLSVENFRASFFRWDKPKKKEMVAKLLLNSK